MKVLWDDFKFIGYTMRHPFEGFYELRFRRKRNWPLIVGIYLMVGVVEVLRLYYTGLVAGAFRVVQVNPMFVLLTTVVPFLLFALSNWSVTTLFDGNGKLGDVFMVIAYALAPKLVLDLMFIGLSNVVIAPEMALLHAISIFGFIIFGFLLFCGLCVAHEYNPAKCIVTIIATLVASLVIVFMVAVYLILIGRFIGLVSTVITEITRRGIF